jgi:hypothetical protein
MTRTPLIALAAFIAAALAATPVTRAQQASPRTPPGSQAAPASRPTPQAATKTPSAQSSQPAQPSQVTSPVLTARDKELLSEALRLKAVLGDQVWPGFAATPIPVIIYNDAFEFLIGSDSPPPTPWARVESDDFGGSPYYRRPAAKPQSFAVEVGDVWAASISSLERMSARIPIKIAPDVYAVLLLHEAFHAFQARRAPARFHRVLALYSQEKTYPASDPAFAKSWTAEGALLAAALKAKDDAECLKDVGDFLESRRARLEKVPFAFGVEDYESEMEWLEGLGKYVEIRFHELAADRAASDLAFAAFKPGLLFWSGDFVRLEKALGSQPGDQRFYLSGMAEARILDRLAPGWKDGFFKAGGSLEDRLTALGEKD